MSTTEYVLYDRPRSWAEAACRSGPARSMLLVAFTSGLGTALLATSLLHSLQPSQVAVQGLTSAAKSKSPSVLAHCEHPIALKKTICAMDHVLVSLADTWHNYGIFSSAMQPFWDESFTYTPMYGIDESVGLSQWYENEMTAWTDAFPWVEFNQMIFVGSGPNASTTTYAVGDWKGPLGPLAPTNRRMTVRITDFYTATADDRILHNYMMIDMLDLLRQQGINPLPLSPLRQGYVAAPNGDGIPAPLAKYAADSDPDEARRVVSAMLEAEWVGTSTDLKLWDRDEMVWYGPVPFGQAVGEAQYVTHFLRPLHSAFAEERAVRLDVFACEGEYCAARGTFSGRHTGRWLGFGPSGRVLNMDFGMHWRVRNGLIVEAWAIFDLPRMLLPLGVDLLHEKPPEMSARHALQAGAGPATEPSTVNSCSNAYTKPPGGSEDESFDCPAFVIRSTDETWHPRSWDATSAAVDKYFAEDWQSVRAFGMMLRGREALRTFMKDWLGGFPDVFIHVADVFCLGNTEVGYKTTMPYVLTATHSGWSKAFGAPTGRHVKYHGIANCYIKKEAVSGQWQYTTEWDLPDMWAFLTALNITTPPAHPSGDLVPVDQCKPLFEWGSGEMNWFPQMGPPA